MSSVQIEPLGDSALLVRLGDRIDAQINARALALAHALREAGLPGIRDIAPAYASVAVRFDIDAWPASGAERSSHERLSLRIHEIVQTLPRDELLLSPDGAAEQGRGEGAEATRRLGSEHEETNPIEIPVCYGSDFGPDLDALAAHTKLDVREVIARHTGAEYRVAMLGFMPGFPYLLGLDPGLHTPRRSTPRTRVPAGSVAIGGAQTGIYPRELPGGWQLIGRTPLQLFDAKRAPPALLRPGQYVRFRAIEAGEFAALAQ